ncbi:MAG: glycosyltransferase family 1 protein [Acidobacteria bacterium]|nr:glycosyltransferase family 1 protein [Acidobacteriota bacterium]
MRLAVVTETFPPEINGVSLTIGQLVSRLSARGHDVQVICPHQDGFQQQDDVSDGLFLTKGYPIPFYPGLKFGAPEIGRLKRFWQEQRPDVVQIVTEGPLGWAAIRAARALEIPMVSDYHTHFDAYSAHYGFSIVKPILFRYLKWFHNQTETTLVPTTQLLNTLQQQGYDHLHVVGRGIDTQKFGPQHRSASLRSQWDASELVLLYVGRIAPEKNIDLAVSAYHHIKEAIPGTKFVLVGDGPARARLQQQFPSLIFTGSLTGPQLSQHYASADMFLFPSMTDTFGNVVLEAMSSGLPVVAYDGAAARELVQPGINGFLAPFGDDKAYLAQAVLAAKQLFQLPAMGASARLAAEKCEWESVVNDLEQILCDVAIGKECHA